MVNNAGYGQVGSPEELSNQEARQRLNVNAPCRRRCCATPHLRRQGTGRVFNISLVGSYTGSFAGWGICCGIKFVAVILT
ncbi:hypothetical protein HHL22_06955 [Hymenobacter sp. RP-2-7]|uniref:SDR family NAD(P)-dependent oxidoreductase n=1 Tax=Hymenobacter polaris TaxID=2682546 RepID=A0A7Y0ACS3_9BACT|nr:hypothetical protein [Hymenobacter polaris]